MRNALDPTLLLDAQDYQEIIDADWDAAEPYLAVYCLDLTDAKRDFVNHIASGRGLQVRFFTAGVQAELTIGQWLAMFSNASLVVTDSFHGTVFSILFGKEFYCLTNPNRGNARMKELLSMLGLENRLLNDMNPDESTTKPIDWAVIDERLNVERERSLSFLASSLD